MFLLGLFFWARLTHVVHGSECLSDALRCTMLYRPFNTYQDLYETSSALNKECVLQARFYSCLRKISLECYSEDALPISDEFEKMQDALLELCTEGTELRENYLVYSTCINKQDTDYCTSEEYLGTELELEPSPDKRCTLTMKSRHCIAHLLKDECGASASDLFKELTYSFRTDDHCIYEEDYYYSDDSDEYEDEDTSELTSPHDFHDVKLGTDAGHDDISKKAPSRIMTDFAKRKFSVSEENESDGECIQYNEPETELQAGEETTERSITEDLSGTTVTEASGKDKLNIFPVKGKQGKGA